MLDWLFTSQVIFVTWLLIYCHTVILSLKAIVFTLYTLILFMLWWSSICNNIYTDNSFAISISNGNPFGSKTSEKHQNSRLLRSFWHESKVHISAGKKKWCWSLRYIGGKQNFQWPRSTPISELSQLTNRRWSVTSKPWTLLDVTGSFPQCISGFRYCHTCAKYH